MYSKDPILIFSTMLQYDENLLLRYIARLHLWLSFMQRAYYQVRLTDSSWDTGGCQFAGMVPQSPRAFAGKKLRPPDWQQFLHQVRKRECR